jgi:hypothetical protein
MIMKKVSTTLVMLLTLINGTALSANVELKVDMYKLYNHLIQMEDAFMTGNKEKAMDAVEALEKESKNLFGDEEKIKQMLPEKQRFKSRIAVTTAVMIQKNIDAIKEGMQKDRRDAAQSAYLDIQRACMRCHNLVRDW